MEITNLEYDFVSSYRMLSDKEKLAVRRYLYLGDKELLRRLLQQRGNQLDDLIGSPVAQSDDESALFST